MSNLKSTESTLVISTTNILPDNVTTNATRFNPENDETHEHPLYFTTELIITTLGCTGNLLLFIMMQRKNFRGQTFRVYLTFAAVTNTIVLVSNMASDGYQYANGSSLENSYAQTPGGCQITYLFNEVVYGVAPWFIVCLNFDRLIIVGHAFRTTQLSTPTRAVQISTIVVVIYFIIVLPFMFYVKVDEDDTGKICEMESMQSRLFPLVHCILSAFMPVLVLFIISILLIRAVKKGSTFQSLTPPSADVMPSLHKPQKINRVVMYISITAVIFLIPIASVELIELSLFYFQDLVSSSMHYRIDVAWEISLLFYMMFFAQTFYIILLTSPTFRLHFLIMIGCVKKRSPTRLSDVVHYGTNVDEVDVLDGTDSNV